MAIDRDAETTLSIYIGDWNMKDRLLYVPRAKAIAILTNADLLARDRMRQVYDLALAEGEMDPDPRASEMDEAELFLSWPGQGPGFVTNETWDAAYAEELANLVDPTDQD